MYFKTTVFKEFSWIFPPPFTPVLWATADLGLYYRPFYFKIKCCSHLWIIFIKNKEESLNYHIVWYITNADIVLSYSSKSLSPIAHKENINQKCWSTDNSYPSRRHLLDCLPIIQPHRGNINLIKCWNRNTATIRALQNHKNRPISEYLFIYFQLCQLCIMPHLNKCFNVQRAEDYSSSDFQTDFSFAILSTATKQKPRGNAGSFLFSLKRSNKLNKHIPCTCSD